jgi:hypothetical protein
VFSDDDCVYYDVPQLQELEQAVTAAQAEVARQTDAAQTAAAEARQASARVAQLERTAATGSSDLTAERSRAAAIEAELDLMLTNLDEAHTARVAAEQQSEVYHLLNDRCTALMLYYALLCSDIPLTAQSSKCKL